MNQKTMKYVYYGFGGFIGFVCGLVVSLIFLAVEKSGDKILSNLGSNYGLLGVWLAEMVNLLPFFGIVFGFWIVKMLFQKRFESERE